MTEKNYCGTSYGRLVHRKKGEKVCEPCRLVANEINTRSRLKNHEKELARHAAYRARKKAERLAQQNNS